MRPHDRRRAHRRLAIALGVLGAALAAGVAVLAVGFALRDTAPASTSDAVRRFRREAGVPGDAGLLRPAPGVYRYDATGHERLSLLGVDQPWGSVAPASVVRERDGCWTWRIEYNSAHWQEQRFCPRGDRLLETGGSTYQRIDLGTFSVDEHVDFTCDPPGVALRLEAEPGGSWTQSCTGRSRERGTVVTSAGRNEFVGVERVQVGQDRVAALHYRITRTLSGDQTGAERYDRWYAVTDAMVLRHRGTVRVSSPSPIGDVVFTQSGDLRLADQVPQR